MQLIKSKQIESLAADKIIETNVRKFVTEEQILRWDTGAGSSGTPGQDGKNIELTKNDTHIMWRVEGEDEWQELVALADITGPAGQDGLPGRDGIDGQPGKDGIDGKNIELTKTSTHIMWRYTGQDEGIGWTPLIELSEITGPAGADGAGINLPNEDILLNISEDDNGNLSYKGNPLTADIDLPTDEEVENMVRGVINNVFN